MQNFLYLCNANTMGKRICDVEVESVRESGRLMGRRGKEGSGQQLKSESNNDLNNTCYENEDAQARLEG